MATSFREVVLVGAGGALGSVVVPAFGFSGNTLLDITLGGGLGSMFGLAVSNLCYITLSLCASRVAQAMSAEQVVAAIAIVLVAIDVIEFIYGDYNRVTIVLLSVMGKAWVGAILPWLSIIMPMTHGSKTKPPINISVWNNYRSRGIMRNDVLEPASAMKLAMFISGPMIIAWYIIIAIIWIYGGKLPFDTKSAIDRSGICGLWSCVTVGSLIPVIIGMFCSWAAYTIVLACTFARNRGLTWLDCVLVPSCRYLSAVRDAMDYFENDMAT